MTFVLFTNTRFGFDERANGLLFMFIGCIAIYIQGSLIRRIVRNGNERKLALAGCLMMVVSLALLGESSPWLSLLSLLAVMAVLSVGNSLATPTLNGLASQCGTIQTQGETMGAMSSAGSLGRFIGPLIAASLSAVYPKKYEYAFWVAAGIMAAAVASVARIRPAAAPAA